MDHRIEKDTMGDIEVPADRLWGAQTQRSLQNFRVGQCQWLAENHPALQVQQGGHHYLLRIGVKH